MKVTAKGIAVARPTNQRQEIQDYGCRGLHLVVEPSGVKSWAVRYSFQGRVRKETLGGFPEVSLAEALVAATKIFEQLALHVDPRLEKRRKRGEPAGRTACVN